MLRSILSLFHNSSRATQFKIISLLIKEGWLTTTIPLSYFLLEDNQINTPLVEEVETKGISYLFPRLLFLYDMLQASEESEEYLRSLSQALLERIANLSTQSHMVTEARNILNSREILPDIWQNVTKYLPKRETGSLAIASTKTKDIADEYVSLHQYSIEKENDPTVSTYYNNFRLTGYQVEMLELLRINLITNKQIDFYVPDYHNKCVIAAVFALELILKKGWKVGINTKYYGYAITDLASYFIDFAESLLPKVFRTFAVSFWSSNPQKRLNGTLFIVENGLLRTETALTREIPIDEAGIDYVINIDERTEKADIEIITTKRDNSLILPSFSSSEIYPVLVTTNNFVLKGKTLIYDPNEFFWSDSILLKNIKKKIVTRAIWEPSIELFKKVDTIVLNQAPDEIVDETYTLLSQHVQGPKKLIVNKIPLPFKIIGGKYIPPARPRVELCGLSYKEILANMSNKSKLNTCYLLMDPTQNIEDKPIVYPIKLNKELYYNYTIPELKEMLKAKNLPVSGNKDALINRLVENQ